MSSASKDTRKVPDSPPIGGCFDSDSFELAGEDLYGEDGNYKYCCPVHSHKYCIDSDYEMDPAPLCPEHKKPMILMESNPNYKYCCQVVSHDYCIDSDYEMDPAPLCEKHNKPMILMKSKHEPK